MSRGCGEGTGDSAGMGVVAVSWWAGPQRGGGRDTVPWAGHGHGQDVSPRAGRVPVATACPPQTGHVPRGRCVPVTGRTRPRPPRAPRVPAPPLRVGHGSVVTPARPPWAGHVPVDRTCLCGHSVSPMGQDTSLVGRTCPHGQDVSPTERTCPQRQDMQLWSQRVPTDRTRPPRRRGHQHRSGNHRGSPVSPCPQAPTVSPLRPLSRRSPPRR